MTVKLAKQYAVDYDHTFGGFGVVEVKSGLFVAHTGTETGARIKARKMNTEKYYNPVYTPYMGAMPVTRNDIFETAETWGEEVHTFLTKDYETALAVFDPCLLTWEVYA